MVEVFYADTAVVEDKNFDRYLGTLPLRVQEEILRYRDTYQRKAKLLARIMLLQQLLATGSGKTLEDWNSDEMNKPFIQGWNNFNISHTSKYVLLCTSVHSVGIDIEYLGYMEDLNLLAENFTAEEQHFIAHSPNPQRSFYEIWVKKEACLKALGTGLATNLKSFSCLGEMVNLKKMNFYFKEIFIDPEYISYLCSSVPGPVVSLKAFQINELIL